MNKRIFITSLFVTLFTFFALQKSSAQASWEKFGQQRIQYKTFTWKYYDSTHFRAFYYRPGKDLAQFILNEAEKELSNIVQMMGGRLPRKLNIIVYNSYSDFVQTNIGRQNDDEFNEADGGRVEVVGDNIPVYFTGDHNDLKKQVKKGVAKVIKDNMLFGDNIKEVVKNAIKMNLPEWYTQGYVQYISEEWNSVKQTEIQSLVESDSSISFELSANLKPALMGHSFWNFLEKKYGENYVSNLLYLTRYRKGVNDALENVVRISSDSVYKEWKAFYSLNVQPDSNDLFGRTEASFLPVKFATNYSQFHLSPNGQQLAYVEKKEGIWSIYIQETDLKDKKVLVTGGIRNLKETNDPNYPLLAWSPNGKKLATLYPYKNQLLLRIYDTRTQLKNNKIISPRKIERVTGMCYGGNESELIFSGIKKGQSDIFRYQYRGNRVVNLTNDKFDDKEPSYVNSGVRDGVIFLSNRTKTILDDPLAQKSYDFTKNYNIFFFNETNQKKLEQITATDKKYELPMQYGLDNFAFIEEINGKRIRKVITVVKDDSTGTTFVESKGASMPYSILNQQYMHGSNSMVEIIKTKGDYKVFNTKLDELDVYDEEHPTDISALNAAEKKQKKEKKYPKYVTEFEDTDTTSRLHSIFTGTEKRLVKQVKDQSEKTLLKRKYKRYVPTFYPDFIISSLDNSLLFTRYQTFQPTGFQFPAVGGFITTSLNDIMEDYKITAGARLPLDFNGIAYFMEFANFKRRRDWKITYFHQHRNQLYSADQAPDSLFIPYPNFNGKVSTDFLQSTFIHPFSPVNSIHLDLGLRYDRIRYLAQDKFTIQFPNEHQVWSFARFEYVHDNSINPMLNIWKGTRTKVFAEYQYQISSPSTGFYNFGFDARHYSTLYKNCILASRIAGGFSGGSSPLLYYLGGVDNPINLNPIAAIATNNPPDPTVNYGFQTTATNLRGYKLQARNGSSYMVVNEEIRLPVYNTFFKRSIKSGFLRNLQLVAFADAGAAWRGIMPDEDNITISKTISNTNVQATLQDTENYIAIGYGLGARTRLLGYFIRVDAAWNIEGSKKPMWHFSLATDF